MQRFRYLFLLAFGLTLILVACLDTISSGGSGSPPITQSEPDDQGEDSFPPPDETPAALTAEECAEFSAFSGILLLEAHISPDVPLLA